MRIGFSLVVMLALGSSAVAQIVDPFPQPRPQPRISSEVNPDQRYCLIERSSGAMNCGFATMTECLQAANAGREGDCDVSPRLTTGSGTREQ